MSVKGDNSSKQRESVPRYLHIEHALELLAVGSVCSQE